MIIINKFKIRRIKKTPIYKKIKTNDYYVKGYVIDNFYVISYNLII